MSNCGFCERRGRPNQVGCEECAHIGPHGACGRDVCVDRCPRPDGRVHGDQCVCGCASIICKLHWRDHAAGHRSDTPTCFPNATVARAYPVLDAGLRLVSHGGAAAALGEEDIAAANRFLNDIAPGNVALLGVLKDLDRSAATVWAEQWGDEQRDAVLFTSEFFEGGGMERVLQLAVDALRKVSPDFDVDTVGLVKQPLSEETAIAASMLLNQPPDGELGPGTAAVLEWLDTATVPDGPDAQARWLADPLEVVVAADPEMELTPG